MSIKRSFLESKWYYRVAKIVFLWVPVILVAASVLLMIISKMSGKAPEAFGLVLQNNISLIVSPLIGLALYLFILMGIWRGFLYIVFGGLTNDMKPKVIAATPVVGRIIPSTVAPDGSASIVNYLKEAKSNEATASAVIILIIIFIWIAFYYGSSGSSTPSSSTSGGSGTKTKTTTCIPTGCGSNWYCSGTYYASSGARKSISGCYASKTSVTSLNSWSGMCRQCP
jgi:hypothetical protein